MKKLYMGQKMIVSALAGMILIPGSVVRIQAAENEEQQSVVPTAGIESALEECYRTKVKENLQLYLVPTDEGEYLNIAFSDTDDFMSEANRMRTVTGQENYIKIQLSKSWNIWMAGQRSGQVRQKDMFPQKSCLQEKMPVFIQGSTKRIRQL